MWKQSNRTEKEEERENGGMYTNVSCHQTNYTSQHRTVRHSVTSYYITTVIFFYYAQKYINN